MATGRRHHGGVLFRAVRKGGRVKPQGLRGIDVARAVKRYAKAAGLDAKEFSGHSLRAGFVTSAAETGASIQEVSRHKSVDVLSGYVWRVDLFQGPRRGGVPMMPGNR